jgi:hypothetical protein
MLAYRLRTVSEVSAGVSAPMDRTSTGPALGRTSTGPVPQHAQRRQAVAPVLCPPAATQGAASGMLPATQGHLHHGQLQPAPVGGAPACPGQHWGQSRPPAPGTMSGWAPNAATPVLPQPLPYAPRGSSVPVQAMRPGAPGFSSRPWQAVPPTALQSGMQPPMIAPGPFFSGPRHAGPAPRPVYEVSAHVSSSAHAVSPWPARAPDCVGGKALPPSAGPLGGQQAGQSTQLQAMRPDPHPMPAWQPHGAAIKQAAARPAQVVAQQPTLAEVEPSSKGKRARKATAKKGGTAGISKKSSGGKAKVATEAEVDIFGGLL